MHHNYLHLQSPPSIENIQTDFLNRVLVINEHTIMYNFFIQLCALIQNYPGFIALPFVGFFIYYSNYLNNIFSYSSHNRNPMSLSFIMNPNTADETINGYSSQGNEQSANLGSTAGSGSPGDDPHNNRISVDNYDAVLLIELLEQVLYLLNQLRGFIYRPHRVSIGNHNRYLAILRELMPLIGRILQHYPNLMPQNSNLFIRGETLIRVSGLRVSTYTALGEYLDILRTSLETIQNEN